MRRNVATPTLSCLLDPGVAPHARPHLGRRSRWPRRFTATRSGRRPTIEADIITACVGTRSNSERLAHCHNKRCGRHIHGALVGRRRRAPGMADAPRRPPHLPRRRAQPGEGTRGWMARVVWPSGMARSGAGADTSTHVARQCACVTWRRIAWAWQAVKMLSRRTIRTKTAATA